MTNNFRRFLRCIEDGRSLKHNEYLFAYCRYDGALYLSGIVVPLSLPSRILNKLHLTHQGVT